MKHGKQVTAQLRGRVEQAKVRILVNSTLSQTHFHIYHQQTKLQEGSVFTGVYLYTGVGGGGVVVSGTRSLNGYVQGVGMSGGMCMSGIWVCLKGGYIQGSETVQG